MEYADEYEKAKNLIAQGFLSLDGEIWTSVHLSENLKFQFQHSLTGRFQKNPPMQNLSGYSLSASWNLSDYQVELLKWVYGEDQEVRFLREKAIPTEPVRAYKIAHIKAVGTALKFRGIVLDCTYSPEDRYKCTCSITGEPANHAKPSWDTSCGFYAMRKASKLQYYPLPHPYMPGVALPYDAFQLEVELYGKVLEGKKGYRAEYQRVLSAKPWKPEAGSDFYLGYDGKLRYHPPEYRQVGQEIFIPSYSHTDVKLSLADVERMLGTEMHLP